MADTALLALRMERQGLARPVDEEAYLALYRDLQPGQNVYWNGFGDPPSLSFRAAFDDIAFNRARQAKRQLVKGRFAGGNLGWVMEEELELFACLYQRPLERPSLEQTALLELIERQGPLTIQQLKEETGLLVKQITPILHRLQEAFLIYEDQYDGEWDRGWYRFGEMFPELSLARYTRVEALQILIERFAYRHVRIDADMVKAFYKRPAKEGAAALAALVAKGKLAAAPKEYAPQAYLRPEDIEALSGWGQEPPHSVFAMHRNDVLYKAHEPALKERFWSLLEGLDYDHEPLQYLLIDGAFHGVCVGHFRNGPYELNDVVCDLPDAEERRAEILAAIAAVNGGRAPERFMGRRL